MTTSHSLPKVSELVIQAGLEHAKNAFNGIELNRTLLAVLYDKTRARRTVENCTFTQARAWALDFLLRQRTPEEQLEYKAYSGALGKMGNLIRQLSRRASREAHRRTERERIMQHVRLGDDNRQYQFIL